MRRDTEVVPLGASVLGSAGPRVGMTEGDSAKMPTSRALEVQEADQVGQRRSLAAFLPYPMEQRGAWSLGEEACLREGTEPANKHLLKK